MGDFNAKVGDEMVEDVVGPSGIGTVNERGSRLIEWCQINDFTITNTWYQNHPSRQWTWKSPGDRNRNKIDYILIQKRFRNAVKTAKSLPGADCDSDYFPAVDKERHVKLFRMLEELDIDGKDLRVIRNLYWDQTTSVRFEGEHSDFKPINRASPQQGDLRLSGPPSGQGAGSGARTCDRKVPADLRADSQATVLPMPPITSDGRCTSEISKRIAMAKDTF
ncbi:craniofacial development protein 2-like [Plakobranchus ocellatus]|uniref:Craniofacial development protein 2-like n=1 Tax=Plakobranchus ocellatus TaxID=259542 RepID=A0AAV4BZS9_9GAST|nr:craniofacial development protein 2-like [Plakobranchus ocellatus]